MLRAALVALLIGQTAPVAPELRPALAQPERKTTVPILLPSVLPYARSAPGQKLNTGASATRTEWTISLFFGRTCGANACTVGALTAKRGDRPATFFQKVKLAKGLRGYYKPLTCGGSCSAPQLEWLSGGVLYRIQLNVRARTAKGRRALMLQTANSAINAGPR